VVERLRRRTDDARSLGFHVRCELLDFEPTWCVIGEKPVIFLDLAQTASEQLQQLEEILAAATRDGQSQRSGFKPGRSAAGQRLSGYRAAA
jgi:hypothetical protein